ncbi:MAG TPA: hypothetical protein VH475_02525 [Tepidisphaeraceae bacterium]|jgi:hypothetical protein
MSKDWMEEESTEETAEEGSADGSAAQGGGGGKKFAIRGTVVAIALVMALRGVRIYNRLWPSSPQRASAASVDASSDADVPFVTPRTSPVTPAHRPAVKIPAATAPANVNPFAIKPAEAAPPPKAPVQTAAPTTRPAFDMFDALLGSGADRYDRRLAATGAQLQAIRTQLDLYKRQHGDKGPEFAKYPAWHQLTHRTRADGSVDAKGELGPYLTGVPVNPMNGSRVVGLTGHAPQPGQVLHTKDKLGWVYCITTQTVHPTDADGKTILDEHKATEAYERRMHPGGHDVAGKPTNE